MRSERDVGAGGVALVEGAELLFVVVIVLKVLLTYLKHRETKKDREPDLSSAVDSLPKWLQCWAEARRQELHLGLPHEWQGPKGLGCPLLLFQVQQQGAEWEVE